MSDISDNESLEKKPKRTMTDAQREALKKGRELAKLNRKAKLEEVVAEVKIPEPETKEPEIMKKPKMKRATKKVEPIREPSPESIPEPVVETKPKRTRKPKEVKVVEPVREPSPPPAKAKVQRQKKSKEVIENTVVSSPQWAAARPNRPSMVFM